MHLVELLLEHCDNFYREDPRECMDPLSGMDQCRQAILAEFARREAVRVKLVDACNLTLEAITDWERDDAKIAGAVRAALAANAELEGM